MVSGPSRSYLWILSRTTSLDQDIYSKLVSKTVEWGFDTTKLIAVKHDRTAANPLSEGRAKMATNAANTLTPCLCLYCLPHCW